MSIHNHGFNTAAKMNEGKLPAAEQPSFNKGQQGKGASIGGKVTARSGEVMAVGGDSHASKLKKTWSQAQSANGRFGNF